MDGISVEVIIFVLSFAIPSAYALYTVYGKRCFIEISENGDLTVTGDLKNHENFEKIMPLLIKVKGLLYDDLEKKITPNELPQKPTVELSQYQKMSCVASMMKNITTMATTNDANKSLDSLTNILNMAKMNPRPTPKFTVFIKFIEDFIGRMRSGEEITDAEILEYRKNLINVGADPKIVDSMMSNPNPMTCIGPMVKMMMTPSV